MESNSRIVRPGTYLKMCPKHMNFLLKKFKKSMWIRKKVQLVSFLFLILFLVILNFNSFEN
jgi:hypothetical protein